MGERRERWWLWPVVWPLALAMLILMLLVGCRPGDGRH